MVVGARRASDGFAASLLTLRAALPEAVQQALGNLDAATDAVKLAGCRLTPDVIAVGRGQHRQAGQLPAVGRHRAKEQPLQHVSVGLRHLDPAHGRDRAPGAAARQRPVVAGEPLAYNRDVIAEALGRAAPRKPAGDRCT